MEACAVRGASKNFEKKRVLTDIGIDIECGEILCLPGPSGAGKMTLIRLLPGAVANILAVKRNRAS